MKYIRLNRIKINPLYFNKILKKNEWVLVKVDNLEEYINNPELYIHKRNAVYYDENNKSLICKNSEISYACDLPYGDKYGQQSLLICDDSVDVCSKIRVTPYASTCKKYIEAILHKKYTDEEINECLNSHSLETHQVPIHTPLPYYYEYNKIHKLKNCVYYDINNAHLDALCEIYPKCKQQFINLRHQINYFKSIGEVDKAQDLKDYVNIYCGNLGKTKKNKDGKIVSYAEHRGTYEWIVNRTRNILQSILDFCDGEIIYANTDGAIIRCAKNKIETSDKLGECKSELFDDNVYALNYKEDNKTSYLIYQYTDTKGNKVIKGNCPNEVRDKIDLQTGKYVTFKNKSRASFRI